MKAIHTPPLQDRVEAVLQRAAKPGSVLRLALATGRLQLDGLIETPLQAGQPRECTWHWLHDARGGTPHLASESAWLA